MDTTTPQTPPAQCAETGELHPAIKLYDWDCGYRWGTWGKYVFAFATTDWSLFEGDAGVFAFAEQSGERDGRPTWRLLYVGGSENFGQDVPNHPKWAAAKDLGATHVIIRVLPDDEREDGGGQTHWISSQKPPLNADHSAYNLYEYYEQQFREVYAKRYGNGARLG